MRYHDMYGCVHKDEQWLCVANANLCYYLTADEAPPLCIARSKPFVTKVMFLIGVARRHFDTSARACFDGKVCIWPLTTQAPAEIASRNRPRGTLVAKPTVSIDTGVCKSFLIGKVLPALVG